MKQESKIKATIGTIIITVLLFLLLWFVYLDNPYVPEEEGIEVAFGDATEGSGQVEPIPDEVPSPPPAPAATPQQPAPPSANDLMTQEDEEALALQREQEKKRKQQELAEAAERERQKQEQAKLEAERRRQELAAEEARKKAEAEAAAAAAAKAAEEQAKKDKAAQLGSLFGNPNNGAGSGDTQGDTKKGNPAASGGGAGSGTSGGHGWSLKGRDLRGKLATPNYNSKAEGKVVVQIRVDKFGKVISATQGQGTDISDPVLINAAINAAKQATFSEGDGDVIGSITYIFKLK
ncbi:MAG: hypothetical protein IJS13_04025 [Paludibacteraceae bacterium]|nr:hypothetical protein [Paludibacteraceae bacterium]